VLDEFRAWQTRPLDPVYPVVYLDALYVSVRDGGQVAKRAFYIALGVGVDGVRDVLGFWVAGSEGSKFGSSGFSVGRGTGRRLSV
jgi:putative transposase